MKRTRVSTVILLAVLGGVGGALLETALAGAGRPILIPPATLPIALVAIGVLVIALALPIRRLTKGKAKAPINPFYATRVVMLAKASSLTGALLAGLGFGVVIYLLTRLAVPGAGSLGLAIAMFVGAGILLAAGLVAEYMCTIPPDDQDDGPGTKLTRVRT
ncbi:MAG: DUF3180 domain-containing protein [Lacisediminihabitans sp.]